MLTNPKIDSDGTKRWYNDQGSYHRVGGPAVEYADGGKQWWVDGKLHRIDGPAVETADGYKTRYIDGIEYYTEEEYWNKIKELGLLQVDRQPRVSRFKILEIRR